MKDLNLSNSQKSLFQKVSGQDQQGLLEIQDQFRLTTQEFKILTEWHIDYAHWTHQNLVQKWHEIATSLTGDAPSVKKNTWRKIQSLMKEMQESPRHYGSFDSEFSGQTKKIALKSNEGKIFGQCPVASEKTVCCNLYTIDPVKNCGFNCSYCSIQTMFKDQDIQFDQDFAAKVAALEFSPDRFYHVGSGQSSDALMWGNRHGILDTLCDLAKRNPQILLELKTKSKNVDYFLKTKVPPNVMCSWSLNPQTVIDHEEHQTAQLSDRLNAARAASDQGILVAFHFHPMFIFEGWQSAYQDIFHEIQNRFLPQEIGMISFGTLTFPKPILNKIREYDYKTKILQMPLTPNPEGKLTYPLKTKVELFSLAWQSFKNWHKDVFFYLCMEDAAVWNEVFGFVYKTNDEFEKAMAASLTAKVKSLSERSY